MSDRRLWLAESCPSCAARSSLRCQTSRYAGKPTRFLHVARGWRQRACPTCKAQPEQLCRTPSGRQAGQPHAARLQRGRRELFDEQQVWEELEQWGAAAALVRFSGGAGSQGSIAAVTLEATDQRELARWSGGGGELPEALAAPIWGRYGLFRGHPRISGLLLWDVKERDVLLAGERGGQKFDELLLAAARQRVQITATTPAPTTVTTPAPTTVETPASSAGAALEAAVPGPRDTSPPAGGQKAAASSCEHCGQPLPAGLRPEARFCSKRCRQASSRQRLKAQPPSPPPSRQETCAWCEGPMPAGRRPEARYCSKRCRQASSRHDLARQRDPDTSQRVQDTATPKRSKQKARNRDG